MLEGDNKIVGKLWTTLHSLFAHNFIILYFSSDAGFYGIARPRDNMSRGIHYRDIKGGNCLNHNNYGGGGEIACTKHMESCSQLVTIFTILPYFSKRKQVTKVIFLVKEQNVSVISTDINGIS